MGIKDKARGKNYTRTAISSKVIVNKKQTGMFQNDVKNGLGVYTHSDGKRFEGTYKNDKRHGQGVIIHKNGRKEKVEYKDGVLVQDIQKIDED